MKRYKVKAYFAQSMGYFDVEANSMQEAKEKAKVKYKLLDINKKPDAPIVFEIMEEDAPTQYNT